MDVIIPGVTSTEAEDPKVTHKPRWKYPVLYLLHGYCNDYSTWERYTSIERYAEERRIAVVTFSAENNMYMKLQDVKKENPIEGLMEPDYEKFLMEELPDFVTSMFPISEKAVRYVYRRTFDGRLRSFVKWIPLSGPFPCSRRVFTAETQLRKNYRENPEVPAYLEKYEPLLLIQKAMKRGEMPDLYYCYGTEDFLYDMQDWFKEKLEENEVKCTIEVLPDYGHEWHSGIAR